jgi:serine/threonine protein kinase
MPPVFKAPELISQKKKYSQKCDIWSAGCIIFNMVTGIPPFYESDLFALQSLILHGKYNGYFPEFDKNASNDLHQLIEKTISINPEERLNADELVMNPWINSSHQRYRQLSRSVVTSAF